MPARTTADDDYQNDPRGAENVAIVGNNIPGDAINFAPPLGQGPTKPLRLSWHDRMELVAERGWAQKIKRFFHRVKLGGRTTLR